LKLKSIRLFKVYLILKKNILITGGAGFIESHLVRLFVHKYQDYSIYNLDNFTYAGNLENLTNIESKANYKFIKDDIAKTVQINELFEKCTFDFVVHLAAESHVDRSITSHMEFVMTNAVGTLNLLNATKNLWNVTSGKYKGYYIQQYA
jgi:dTDP-glucose 4,6-dehydratase